MHLIIIGINFIEEKSLHLNNTRFELVKLQ